MYPEPEQVHIDFVPISNAKRAQNVSELVDLAKKLSLKDGQKLTETVALILVQNYPPTASMTRRVQLDYARTLERVFNNHVDIK
jgi:hypothetical protein